MVTRQRTSKRTSMRRGGRTARTATRRGRTSRARASNPRRGRTSARTGRPRMTRGRTARTRTVRRRTPSRATRTRRNVRPRAGTRRTNGARRRLPARDANGRFVRRRLRASPRPARTPARRRTRRVARPAIGSSIVREASERSRAGPPLVKRRWYKIDGPVDPSLPEGYAYER